jgi:hypothetical protein
MHLAGGERLDNNCTVPLAPSVAAGTRTSTKFAALFQ